MLQREASLDPERVVTFMGIGVLWAAACVFYAMWEVGYYLYDMATEVLPSNKSN